jgi:hypothetical protein
MVLNRLGISLIFYAEILSNAIHAGRTRLCANQIIPELRLIVGLPGVGDADSPNRSETAPGSAPSSVFPDV